MKTLGREIPFPIDREALRRAAESFGLDMIVLFGSYAKGRARTDSDADVAILVDVKERERLGWVNLVEWELEVMAALSEAIEAPEGIDLVVLNRAPSLLLFNVVRHGALLYEKVPGLFRRYSSYAVRRYYDDAKYYRRRKKTIIEQCRKWAVQTKS